MLEVAHESMILGNLIVAGLLTPVIGVVVVALLQRAMLRNMAASGGSRVLDAFAPGERPRRAADVPLVLAGDNTATAARDAGLAGRILFRMAAAHALAGFAFGLLAALVLLLSGIEFLP